jgi:hypothetical protein
MLTGGAKSLDDAMAQEPALASRLTQLFSRGVARAAVDAGALIIAGGTRSGVMKLMGQGVADRGHAVPLIGVAPAGKVYQTGEPPEGETDGRWLLEPNHSHFVLVKSDQWGSESDTMYALAAALVDRVAQPLPEPDESAGADAEDSDSTDAQQRDGGASPAPQAEGEQAPPEQKSSAAKAVPKLPVITLVAGGNPDGISKAEVLRSVRHKWPIVVLEGSGGLADKLAKLCAQTQAKDAQDKPFPEELFQDPALAEIVEEGQIYFFRKRRPVKELRPMLVRLLPVWADTQTLKQAWTRFAIYDEAAERHQKVFHRLQWWILFLGIVVTFLVVLKSSLEWLGVVNAPDAVAIKWITNVLYYVILIIPITSTILITASNKFTSGFKWILLRSSAEAIKREIYTYRARTGKYGEAETTLSNTTPRAELAKQVETISRRLMRTEVNMTALGDYTGPIPPNMDYAAPGDDGLSPLGPHLYVAVRLGDQINYYDHKTVQLERELKRYTWLVWIVGGVGTFLAAVNAQTWIAVTTAIVSAFATYLEYNQTGNTLLRYNQVRTDLKNVREWWEALSPMERENPENIRRLVTVTEKLLRTELVGWVQEMQDALDELREEQQSETNGQEGQPEGSSGT